jgi:hypothetical protein
LHVSEHKSEQTSGESGSLDTGSAVAASSDAQGRPGQGAATEVEPPKTEAAEPEALKAEVPTPELTKPEAASADAPRVPGKVMIMSSGDRAWESGGAGPEVESKQDSQLFGQRRLSALAAIVALAMMAGALGGALATAGLGHFAGKDTASAANGALEASVARIDAELLGLKASVEHTSKMSMAQVNKTSDRIDKLEKAQAEPAARLAKLSEAVDKLRAALPVAPAAVAAAPAAAKEVTGSIAPPAAAPKVEVARLPTVEGWVLRDVANGGALIEGRQGMYEVYAGDPVPGLGRVDAIRRQDGRWVVVTSRGLIVAR